MLCLYITSLLHTASKITAPCPAWRPLKTVQTCSWLASSMLLLGLLLDQHGVPLLEGLWALHHCFSKHCLQFDGNSVCKYLFLLKGLSKRTQYDGA